MTEVKHFAAVPMIFAASIIYLIASSIVCDRVNYCKKEYGYAVAVAVVSIVISGILMALRLLKKEGAVERFNPIISLFLFLWWIIGASVGTFRAPFVEVGNGYFSGWAAFLFSTKFAYETNAAVKNILDKGAHAMGGGHHTGGQQNADAWNAGAAEGTGTGSV